MRLILPTFFIIISGALIFIIGGPIFKDVKVLREDVATYNTALASSTNLQSINDSLIETYKNIPKENKEKLDKLLPNTVNNIKFILEVEQVAGLYGMPIKDIKFDPKNAEEKVKDTSTSGGSIVNKNAKKDLPYGVFPIEFTTEGDYNSFSLFLKDLEENLRLVDVKSISFSVPDSNKITNTRNTMNFTNPNIYQYTLKVETYWLK